MTHARPGHSTVTKLRVSAAREPSHTRGRQSDRRLLIPNNGNQKEGAEKESAERKIGYRVFSLRKDHSKLQEK